MIYVLLVHDNSDIIESTRALLERRGDVRVDVVHSTKQALERARSRRYDVIVSYHRIPEIDGIEFLADMTGVELQRELKSLFPATPFILYLREGRNSLVLGDVNLTTEVPVRSGSPPRPMTELQEMIYQAVLRRKSERDLVLRADFLSAILSVAPMWLCQVANGKVEWVNSTMAQSLGMDAASFKGRDVADLFPGKEEFDRAFREFALRSTTRDGAMPSPRSWQKTADWCPCTCGSGRWTRRTPPGARSSSPRTGPRGRGWKIPSGNRISGSESS